MLWILLIILLGLLVLGFPMMVPMIVAPLVVLMVYFPNINPMMMTQQLIAGIAPFVLLAVPMFILAADIMITGQTANRLLDFVEKFVGHIYGGLAITTAATCTLFGAISGATQATVVAIGKPMYGRLTKDGYGDSESLALIINSSIIALLIPPSIVMIMYCVITGASVGELFIAGIGPGLIIFLFFAVYSYFKAKREGIPLKPKANWRERLEGVRKALLPLGFPAIIIGGIYTGFFSPTEAAAASVLYAAFLEILIFKSIKVNDLPQIALSTALVTAAVFILVGAGGAFSWAISYAKIPQMITANLLGVTPSAFKVLVVVTIFYFVGCMFVDQLIVIMILTPIFYPAAAAAGIDPIHLGIIVTLQAAIGSVTPPFGCNIFTACAIFNKPYLHVIKGIPPYLIMLAIISFIMIVFPQAALFFRDLAF